MAFQSQKLVFGPLESSKVTKLRRYKENCKLQIKWCVAPCLTFQFMNKNVESCKEHTLWFICFNNGDKEKIFNYVQTGRSSTNADPIQGNGCHTRWRNIATIESDLVMIIKLSLMSWHNKLLTECLSLPV